MPTNSLDVLKRLPSDVPEPLAARLDAGTGDAAVAPARPAASVLLVRDGATGLETYLLSRHARMPFAPNMVVFPGGGVDPADADSPDPLSRCAVRETAEETGVVLGEDDLQPWAHWITPEVEPRRYDAAFFLAALPEAQDAQDISGETDTAQWATPIAALAAAEAGTIALMPPTRSMLLELVEFASVAEALAAAVDRRIATVLPRVARHEDRWVFVYPEPQGE